jgi:hypothetical protein
MVQLKMEVLESALAHRPLKFTALVLDQSGGVTCLVSQDLLFRVNLGLIDSETAGDDM